MPGKFAQVKKGYDPQAVDHYIETLESVIRNYKEKDSAINNALISAQITADSIIKEASRDAMRIRGDMLDKLEAVSDSIAEQKKIVKEFQDDYNQLARKYLQDFNEAEITKLYGKINELEDYIEKLESDERVERFQNEASDYDVKRPNE